MRAVRAVQAGQRGDLWLSISFLGPRGLPFWVRSPWASFGLSFLGANGVEEGRSLWMVASELELRAVY